MKKNAYWRKREEEQLKHYISEDAEIQRIMANKYAYMLRQIEMQINDFYARYARAEKITLAEAQQRVSKMDVQAFAAKAKKYVQEKDFSPQANKELKLYNATMRINRLELLKANIGLEMIDGFNDIESTLEQGLTKRTIDEFERQEEILRRDAGILNTTVFDNAKSARSIVNASFQNATWSTRIWGNQSQLRDSLSALLTNGLIQGRNPLQLAPALRDLFGASRKAAERLMVTEMARVQTGAQMESYKRNDIDQYEFISVDKACATCMELDGKHFRVSDMAPGENAPPIHPHCRCSTAAYVDREKMERELFGGESEERRKKPENPNTVIDASIHKNDYGKSFSKLGESKKVIRAIREAAVDILDHRSGTEYEDLAFIDSRSGKTRINKGYDKKGYANPNKPMNDMIDSAEPGTIIAVHNHPNSTTPSIGDIKAAVKRNYKYGVIVCHNGRVFKYSIIGDVDYDWADMHLDLLNSLLYNNGAIEKINNVLRELADCGVKLEVIR